jgi:hypothetical protein
MIPATTPDFVGIFELDTEGNVLYSRNSAQGIQARKSTNLVGRNFFGQVADFENITDLRRRFREFVFGHSSAENFLFECRLNEETLPVRILMMRAREINEAQVANIVILDIRRNDG